MAIITITTTTFIITTISTIIIIVVFIVIIITIFSESIFIVTFNIITIVPTFPLLSNLWLTFCF